MDGITELIKNEIKRQYKSVRRFSEVSGIPYSTLSNALAKGIGGTSYDTVVKICALLGIKQATNSDLVLFNKEFHEIYAMLTELDEQGVHTVETILRVEHARCCQNMNAPVIKAFNGIGYASNISTEQEYIKTLVRKALEDEKKSKGETSGG